MGKPALAEIQGWVKTQVSPFRFQHIQGVAQTAERLAVRYGLSLSKARLAAWLHDCGKEYSKTQMKTWLRKGRFPLDQDEKEMPGLWHPHVGSAIAQVKWGIKDPSILEAIRCHTLGRAGMSPLAQLIFVADFIEPGRNFPGIQTARRITNKSLTEGILTKASMTIKFLFDKKMRIHTRLLETWNYYRTVIIEEN